MPSAPLVLASASPRRIELLRLAGFDPLVDPADVDETPDPSRSPVDNATVFAADKARTVAARHPGSVVIAADTIVVVDDLLLGKPTDRDDARRMLVRLGGRRHQVVTCVHIQAPGARHAFAVTTDVLFRDLSGADVESYLDAGEWTDKAGSYAVQGRAAAFTRALHGSYTNVVGLPVCEVVDALAALGVLPGASA